GSIRLPRGPVQEKTYAIIESTPEQYLVQYYNKEYQPLERLKATFTK
ncbi:MAG: YfcE family phosphodiesterase, partial [Enterococcus faecalis]|nr:YfcE family phosphodiesterase [Enterococcus faecalis]